MRLTDKTIKQCLRTTEGLEKLRSLLNVEIARRQEQERTNRHAARGLRWMDRDLANCRWS